MTVVIHKQRGFTLIEIVVAVAILAVISGIVFPALMQFLELRERIVAKQDDIKGLQKTFLFMAQDLRYIANHLTKDDYGDSAKTTLSINDDSVMDFVAMYPDIELKGLPVPRRVRWVLSDDKLFRVQYPVMDPESQTASFTQSLLEGVDSAEARVYQVEDGREGSVKKRWQETNSLPDMIELELKLANGNSYQRKFIVLGGVPKEP